MEEEKNKINLLHLITGLGVGGAERVVLDLAKNIDKSRFQLWVISLSKQDDMLGKFKEEKIDILSLGMSNGVKNLAEMIRIVSSHIREHKIQLIHAHMTDAMVVAVMVKILNPKLKLVFTSHNFTFGSKLRTMAVQFLKPFRDIDILFSKEQLSSIYKKNHEIIPNGIDTSIYQLNLKKNKRFTFITVGRLEKQKNHIKLLESVLELKNRNLDFQVQIVGEGKDPIKKEKIENFITSNQLESHVQLLGMRFDIPALISRADCFVLTSTWEGLPIVLLEAGASKIPIISTPVGSIPSLIDEHCGYLSDEKFTEAMVEVMLNYPKAQKKALKLYEKVEDSYSIKSVVRRHEKIYEELV